MMDLILTNVSVLSTIVVSSMRGRKEGIQRKMEMFDTGTFLVIALDCVGRY